MTTENNTERRVPTRLGLQLSTGLRADEEMRRPSDVE